MSTIRHTCDSGAADTIEEQFLELVCSDVDLVRGEFEAIIAAEWPTPPPVRPPLRRPAGGPGMPRRGRRWSRRVGHLPSRPQDPSIGAWSRQRSPPDRPATPQHENPA